MAERFTLDITKDNTVCGQITLDCIKMPDGVQITVLEGPAKGDIVTAADYFAALAGLRKRLAQEQLKPVCLGACRFVYPSGMSRDMALGRAAYLLESKRQASRDDLVDIFDPLPEAVPLDSLVYDEAEQLSFRLTLIG